MCGIIGYTGEENAVSLLVEGLRALSYRGYDSSGIAVAGRHGLQVVKAKGKLEQLERFLAERTAPLSSCCGIGHTRWATHGSPSDRNSHPHGDRSLMLVHNGIIENYAILKDRLMRQGISFVSDTDTEVAARLLSYYYQQEKEALRALLRMVGELQGSFAFAVLFWDQPDTLYAVRKDSPLIVAAGPQGNFVASDVPAVLRHTKEYYPLEDRELAIVGARNIEFYDFQGNRLSKEPNVADWDWTAAEKGNFEHFMLKEIYEQPQAVFQTISPHWQEESLRLQLEGMDDRSLASFQRIYMVACGSAMHAGMVGKAILEQIARIPVTVEIASEFRYNNPIFYPDDLVVVISQSGETADSLAALRLAKTQGVPTLAIVNVVGSSLAREADAVLYTHAGPEIAVASTKGYLVQVSVLYLLAIRFGLLRGQLSEGDAAARMHQLTEQVPTAICQVLQQAGRFRKLAEQYRQAKDFFFLGRGLDYSLSLEGSLKLKEISYIHSDAYAAGELKHGTISLITEGTPVIAIATRSGLFEKMASNIKEVKARGAHVLLLCSRDMPEAEELGDDVFYLPALPEWYAPMTAVPALQLLAYYVALLRDCDVDKPRNLAKSVTVE